MALCNFTESATNNHFSFTLQYTIGLRGTRWVPSGQQWFSSRQTYCLTDDIYVKHSPHQQRAPTAAEVLKFHFTTPYTISGATNNETYRNVRVVSSVMIWRRNRFQGTGSKVPEPVPKPCTRNLFLNIVSLTHCIICVLYESLFVNNESRNIGLKLCVIVFTFYSFIHSFVAFISSQIF